MANASAKRIAHQNEAAVRSLKLGMVVPTILSLLLRFLFRRASLPPSKTSLAIYVLTFFPSLFLSNYLIKIGTPRRDPTTGTLLSYGEDLAQSGVTEWCFDILYVTWACQVGSGAFGEWFWFLYMVIPLFAIFKLYSSIISPYLQGRSSMIPDSAAAADDQPTSKRQEKLRKRSEKGDPRVRMQARK